MIIIIVLTCYDGGDGVEISAALRDLLGGGFGAVAAGSGRTD